MLKLMYITNRPEIAQIAESAGVDRIFVDLEYIGKIERQGGMDTVQSHHTLNDVKRIAEATTIAELLVRVNPIHDATAVSRFSMHVVCTASQWQSLQLVVCWNCIRISAYSMVSRKIMLG